ncbi:anaerobic ribonucleoside-triphosphate reductase activating protein [Shewanella atlantica]|uniref:Anaerobic ribonucleoside-triphosphate reductase activating protein n=1 Tax=Shewanella atlantica TaxID=271099 RepID=A0A431W9Q6_9GAMM|nr:anaerobic ribonucleoside-triphosphate reductase activating protein [Shewanella atlantica]RTR32210.1 anaerobic ribonucleoside-triphosphate reductase activating protein [Shewanella atlantica]
MFNSLPAQVVMQEVPGEISLLFSITGCDVGCKGCHSTELWNEEYGEPLNEERYKVYLKQYQGYVSCILFFGGEWQPKKLSEYLVLAKKMGFKTCLYTGREQVGREIRAQLDFLKTGEFDYQVGGLDSPDTNQKFYDLAQNKIINYKFIKD